MGFSNLVIFSWEIHSFIKTVKTKESHLTYDNQRGLGWPPDWSGLVFKWPVINNNFKLLMLDKSFV